MILKNSEFNSLDEIKRAIPAYYLEFDDYMAIQRFVADEMDNYNIEAMKVLDNSSILKCDEGTLVEIEKFLKIYDITDRVISRSIYVNGVLTSIGKLSVSKLRSWIKTVLNQEPEIKFITDNTGNRILSFEFEDRSEAIPGVILLIKNRLPAGMIVSYINKCSVSHELLITQSVVLDEVSTEIKAEETNIAQLHINNAEELCSGVVMHPIETIIYPVAESDQGYAF